MARTKRPRSKPGSLVILASMFTSHPPRRRGLTRSNDGLPRSLKSTFDAVRTGRHVNSKARSVMTWTSITRPPNRLSGASRRMRSWLRSPDFVNELLTQDTSVVKPKSREHRERRSARRARRDDAGIAALFQGGATKPCGMQRRSNATGLRLHNTSDYDPPEGRRYSATTMISVAMGPSKRESRNQVRRFLPLTWARPAFNNASVPQPTAYPGVSFVALPETFTAFTPLPGVITKICCRPSAKRRTKASADEDQPDLMIAAK